MRDAVTVEPPVKKESRCVQLGLAARIFFPEERPIDVARKKGDRAATLVRYEVVRPICQPCTERAACRDFAIATGSWDGMFGGLTPVERWRYAHQNGKSMFKPIPHAVAADALRQVVQTDGRMTATQLELDRERIRAAAAAALWTDDPSLEKSKGGKRAALDDC